MDKPAKKNHWFISGDRLLFKQEIIFNTVELTGHQVMGMVKKLENRNYQSQKIGENQEI